MSIARYNLPSISSDLGLQKYLCEINSIPSLSKEEEFMLAKHYLEQRDLEAAHKLVTSHMKLVAKIAMQYRHYGLPVQDLISEGSIGLMKAVKKYDPDLGHRLSTYAMWWIKASVQEYVLKSWSLVKIGTTSAQKKLFFSLNKIKNRIRGISARSINDDDYQTISTELGVSKQEVVSMDQRLSGSDISLNRSVGHDDDAGEMIDFLPSNIPSQENVMIVNQDAHNSRTMLSNAMKVLNEREVKILKARKLQDKPSTLETLSSEYNISKERVRQIENRAFDKIKIFILNQTKEQQKYLESQDVLCVD